MLIDSDEAIKRMQNVIEHYKKIWLHGRNDVQNGCGALYRRYQGNGR